MMSENIYSMSMNERVTRIRDDEPRDKKSLIGSSSSQLARQDEVLHHHTGSCVVCTVLRLLRGSGQVPTAH